MPTDPLFDEFNPSRDDFKGPPLVPPRPPWWQVLAWLVAIAVILLLPAVAIPGDTTELVRVIAARVRNAIVSQPVMPDRPPNLNLRLRIAGDALPDEDTPGACPSEASVLIETKKPNRFGSGVYVRYKGYSLLLTAAHVVEGLDEKSTILAGGVEAKRVLLDRASDIAVLWTGEHPAVELAEVDPLVGDAVVTGGRNAAGLLAEADDTVIAVLESSGWRDLPGVECKSFPPLGRSGGGLFRNGELVGVLHFHDPKRASGVYSRSKTVRRILESVNLTGQRRATVYTGESVYGAGWCRNCGPLKNLYGEGNEGIRIEYSGAAIPSGPESYPAVRFFDANGTSSYPVKGGVYAAPPSLEELILLIDRNDPPCVIPVQRAPAGARRPRQPVATSSIEGRERVEAGLNWLAGWLPDTDGVTEVEQLARSRATFRWQRNGVGAFPLLAGKSWTLKELFGSHGHFRVRIPAGRLPINEFGTGYELRKRDNGTDFAHFTPDPLGIDLPSFEGDAVSSGSAEDKAYGIDPITLGFAAIQIISGVWQLMHPEANLTLGPEIEVAGEMRGGSLFVTFSEGAPAIEVRAWFIRAKMQVTSVEVSPENVRLRFAKNFLGIQHRDIAVN